MSTEYCNDPLAIGQELNHKLFKIYGINILSVVPSLYVHPMLLKKAIKPVIFK